MTSAAIVTIGTEITRGELRDSNGPFLAEQLITLGFDVHELVSVDDDVPRIEATLRRVGAAVDVVLVTGGLGPTSDDVTVQAASQALGVLVVRDEKSLQMITRKITALGREMTESRASMADVPEGSEVLSNPIGSAPGFACSFAKARAFFMPGVPTEMRAIFETHVVSRIGPMAHPTSAQIVLRTYGAPEATVGERLEDLEARHPGLTLGYRLVFPEIEVKVRVQDSDLATARARARAIANEARNRLGAIVHGEDEDSFARSVGRALRARGFTLALAESCTGGLAGALLTAVAGSSEYLLLDAVTYSNASKERLLGVSPEILMAHGAVSPETAEQMAVGARRVANADIAVSVTGIAGPSGGSELRPVGTVHFAVATSQGVHAVSQRFDGDRERIQRASAFFALSLVLSACSGDAPLSVGPHCT
ncbi:MAG: CinA family nicotinamide mononucleotide deamidase-related protein [Deltaproteobacteria bacterium]|nr:CinA family nicotinamide mononucleotide deamidase-related protein [Deltaproteobacteria bacterium]